MIRTFFKHTTYCKICKKCQKEQVVESVSTRTNSDAYTIAALRMQVLLQEALKKKSKETNNTNCTVETKWTTWSQS